MRGKKSHTDGKFVVKFPAIPSRGHTKMRSKSPKRKRCRPCSVLLLSIDALLKTKTVSLRNLDRQLHICKEKCQKLYEISSTSNAVASGETSPDVQEYAVVIKQEPLSPHCEATDTDSEAVGPLSELVRITGNVGPCSSEHGASIPVKVEVGSDAGDEKNTEGGYTNDVTIKKRGINSDYRITTHQLPPSESAPTVSTQVKYKPPPLATQALYDTPATDMLRQAISKTAVVQPTVFSTTVTSTTCAPLSRNTLTSSKTSTSTIATPAATLPSVLGNQLPTPGNVKTDTQPASAINALKKFLTSSKTTTSTTATAPSTSGDMSILQLMNGLMVLVPTDTVRQLSITNPNLPSLTLALPPVAPPSVRPILPALSTATQPAIALLPPTGSNLITPAVTPSLYNILPGQTTENQPAPTLYNILPGQTTENQPAPTLYNVLPGLTTENQPGMSNPIIFVPPTEAPNTQTLLLQQPAGNQVPNLFAVSNPSPTVIQIPNTPVPQQQTTSVIPGIQASTEIKPPIQIPNLSPADCRPFLRLTDGQLVPIVSDPSSLFHNKPVTSTAKSNESSQVSFAVNSSVSALRGSASLNGNRGLQIMSSAQPIYEQSQAKVPQFATANVPPHSVNVNKAEKDIPHYLQLPNGTLVPIAKPEEQTIQPSVQVINKISQKYSKGVLSNNCGSKFILQNGHLIPVSHKIGIQPQPSKQTASNSLQQQTFLMDKPLLDMPSSHDTFLQARSSNEQKPISGSESIGKKPQPVILQTNRSRLTRFNGSNILKASHSAPYIQISPKPDPQIADPRLPPVNNATVASSSQEGTNSQEGTSKPSSKRKSVNIVREDFDSHKKKTKKRMYFTHEVIDVDKEPEVPEKDDGQSHLAFMGNVAKPVFHPVLLNSTIEEKGLRLPDNMLF